MKKKKKMMKKKKKGNQDNREKRASNNELGGIDPATLVQAREYANAEIRATRESEMKRVLLELKKAEVDREEGGCLIYCIYITRDDLPTERRKNQGSGSKTSH